MASSRAWSWQQDPALRPVARRPPYRRPAIWLAVILAWLVAFAGLAAWIDHLVFAKLRGADTPQGAATRLLEGVARTDYLAVFGITSKAELRELSKRQILPDDAELAPQVRQLLTGVDTALRAVDLELSGLEYALEPLPGGAVKITVTGGTYRITVDPEAFSFGAADISDAALGNAKLRERLQLALTKWMGPGRPDLPPAPQRGVLRIAVTAWLRGNTPIVGDFASLRIRGERPFIVVVPEKGKWYFSPQRTAEQYRQG